MRYVFALIVALFLLSASGTVNAQVGIHLNFNVSSQPVWGPTGYDYVEYYYIPDIDAYYNVPQHRYYYNNGGRWVGRSRLPSRYNNFDLYNSHKVVVNEREPWRNHDTYRDKYSSFRGNHDQETIRDSRDSKYFGIKNHPEHKRWLREQRHDNGNHNGWNNGNNGDGGKKENKQKNK